jgi:hypothetical protein
MQYVASVASVRYYFQKLSPVLTNAKELSGYETIYSRADNHCFFCALNWLQEKDHGSHHTGPSLVGARLI